MRGFGAAVIVALALGTFCASAAAQLPTLPGLPLPVEDPTGLELVPTPTVEGVLAPLVCEPDPATATTVCTIGSSEAGCEERTLTIGSFSSGSGSCTVLVLRCTDEWTTSTAGSEADRSCGVSGTDIECRETSYATFGSAGSTRVCTVGGISYRCDEGYDGESVQPYTCRPEGVPG